MAALVSSREAKKRARKRLVEDDLADDYETAPSPEPKRRVVTAKKTRTETSDAAAESATVRKIIAFDLGTTYATAAFVTLQKGETGDQVHPDRIRFVERYPDDFRPSGEASAAVPTLLYYEKKSSSPIWGFSVAKKLKFPNDSIHDDEGRFVTHPKLLLDTNDITTDIRAALKRKTDELIRAGVINDQDDILRDFLAGWMAFVKHQLVNWGEILPKERPQFAICIPSHWTIESYNRLCKVMENALRSVWTIFGKGPIDLFTVAEPEAAAACILTDGTDQIRANDITLVIDAGGGTIEMNTYRTTSTDPFRFEEVCKASAAVCGSDLMNEAMRARSIAKLEKETYLTAIHDTSIPGIVDSRVMPDFENTDKRNIDLSRPNGCQYSYPITGLKPNSQLGFQKQSMTVSTDEIKAIFDPVHVATRSMLQDQFNQVAFAGQTIDYVVLAGGFSDNPALRNCVQDWLTASGYKVRKLILPNRSASTAVAKGSCLRALNKQNGPTRYIRSSFGLVRHQRLDPEEQEELDLYDPECRALSAGELRRGADGNTYVFHTIQWFIKLGEELTPGQKFVFVSHHVFEASEEEWLGSETIYYAPTDKISYYQKSHKHNSDARVLGCIELDMTSLKVRNVVKPNRNGGRMYYDVVVRVAVELLEGFRHTLHCTAQWAPTLSDDGQELEGGQSEELAEKEVINIVAHFDASTA